METTPKRSFQVARDGDRHAVRRNVGIGILSFKVTTADSNGAILVAEIVHARSRQPRPLSAQFQTRLGLPIQAAFWRIEYHGYSHR